MLEADYGWITQPTDNGSRQHAFGGALRYGVTPRLDVRWGTTNSIMQVGESFVQGTGDQWLGARFRFHEQTPSTPAFALMYNFKFPTASSEKGFGSGYVEQTFLFIASKDIARFHLDFNTVGDLTGNGTGHDGGVLFGLALWRPVNGKLAFVIESYGGTQPGTTNRLGTAVAGATYNVSPRLVFDTAYYQTYTAASPRRQFTIGVTYTIGPVLRPAVKTMMPIEVK
jgi:hypothetical protein